MMNFRVERISGKLGKAFIRQHHYTHSCHNGPMTWGMFSGEELVGVIAFATPGSENVRSSVFGEEFKGHITELHRLVILDKTPPNAESWFISRAIKELKKERPWYWGILSFADMGEGHLGTIYQATNALYLGETKGGSRFFRDQEGRLRHPRQSGHNVTLDEASAMGWTPEIRSGKYRYLYIMPNSIGHKKFLIRKLKFPVLPYPKPPTT